MFNFSTIKLFYLLYKIKMFKLTIINKKDTNMNNFGNTIRKLRISRRITQEQLARGLFNRSSLSKIEHEELEASYENQVQLIRRLGLTPNEFEYICDNYHVNNKNQLLHRFFNLENSNETDKVEALLNDCIKYENDNDVSRIVKILQSVLLLNQPRGINQAKKLVQPIWFDYLAKVDLLTITDIAILNTILYAFDYQTAKDIIKRINSEIDTHYPFKKALKANTMLNISSIQMQQQKFESAASTLIKLKPTLKKLRQYDKLLVANIRISICEGNKATALKQVNLLHQIDANRLATAMEQEIQEYL